MSNSVQPHRRQPTRLPRPWDSPGKNTGVGCHFFLQCMKVKSQSEVTQSCPTLIDPIDCSPPGSSVHGVFQARVLEWGATAFSGTVCLKIVKKENSVVCYLSQFLKILPFFFLLKVLAMPHSMWALSSPTRDWTPTPYSGRAKS